MGARRIAIVGAVVLALSMGVALGPSASRAVAQGGAGPGCVGDVESHAVAQQPGPLLRFGIGPLVQAGQIGPAPGAAVPERPEVTDSALARLRPPGGAFVLRLNRFFWSDREAGIRRYLALAERFTKAGYLIELQVRYHPDAEQEGDIAAWTEHVREVVRRFGANPRVIALQIANEVNLTVSPDSSDGSFEGARDALVQGVIAAKDEARQRGHDGLEIGFNWAYRTDPASEESFWRSLRDRGGAAFVNALDWIGLDAYPGTVFPPTEPDLDGYRDGMVNAMSSMRCYAAIPGIPASVPMKVEENGWPTFPGRSWAMQADVLRTMVGAVHDFRGTYNVTDYRWFNLRDGDSSSPQPFQHFGLLDSGYVEKPAFEAYRGLVAALARREAAGRGNPRTDGRGLRGRDPLRLALRLRFRSIRSTRAARCATGPVTARVVGADRRLVRRTRFRLGSEPRRGLLDRRAPFQRVVDRRRHRGLPHVHRARAGMRLRDGRLVRRSEIVRVCPER